MKISLDNIQWVEFKQKEITSEKENQIELFELISPQAQQGQQVDYQAYCQLLLEKIFSIHDNITINFLRYQCDNLSTPVQWLKSIEILLKKNIDELFKLGLSSKVNQLFFLIDKEILFYSGEKRSESPSSEPPVSEIEKIRNHLKGLSTYGEKKTYLARMKTDYLQQPKAEKTTEPTLDKQIDLEFKFLKDALKFEREKMKELKTKIPALVWNGQINQLIDIFFQCMHQKNEDDEFLIDASNEEVVRFIIAHFRKKDGTTLSSSTVRTILKPSRSNKRPKLENKIKVKPS